MSIKKRLLAVALAGVISTGFSGCKKEEKHLSVPKDVLNHYNNYTQVDIEDETLVNKYNGSNIVISVNKETNEVNEYLYYVGEAKNYLYQGIDNAELLNSLGFIVEIFDLETGKLVYFNSDKEKEYNIGTEELSKLMAENDFYNIYELYDLGIEFKEWYTIEEIKEIGNLIVNKNIKIKKLSN